MGITAMYRGGKEKKEKPEEKTEISETNAPPLSKELTKRRSHFIRKVYETDPLICPKCQGVTWFDMLTTLRGLEGRMISFIDQPEVIKKILQHLGLWEQSQAPPESEPSIKEIKEINFDPSYSQLI